MTTQHSFYLAELFVNPAELSIHTPAGQVVSLQQKPMDVLVFLAQQYPALVSRQQLIDNVWGGNVYVGEKALTNAIWQLRNVLQQLAQMDLICTVRKKGYRLAVAPVPSALSDDANPPKHPQPVKRVMPVTRRLLYLFAAILLLACGALLFYYPAAAPVATEVTVLTNGNGRAMFPSLSADERYLVFSWRKFEAASDLYSLDLTEPDKPARQLTFTPDDESRPLWAKDGRHVYYSSKTAVYGECNIMQLDTVTLHSQKLANCNRHSTGYMDITPDGRYLAFSGSMNTDGSSLYQLDLQNPEAKPQAVPCTQNCQYLIRDLAFSPDGRYLAVTRRAHRLSEDIYLHNLASGEEQKLTQGEEDILGLSWHPDSQRLLFGALQHGKRQGFVLNVVEGTSASLQLDNFAWPSRVASNGEVYFHNSKSVPQLAYLPLNSAVSAAVFPLTANEARYEAPNYSKTRHALAYVSNESGYMEIWQADAEMENRRQLTQLHGMVKYPQWSNNGRYIAFVGRLPTEEEDKLMLLEVQTGKLTQLNTGVLWHGRLSWWFDDSAVIFAYDGNLFSVDIATSAVEQLTLKGGAWGQMPAAERFYFSKGRNRGLWQLLPDGTEQQLLPGSVFSSRTAWTVAGQSIYFLQQKPGQLLVSRYDTVSGKVEDLILLPPDLLHPHSIMSYDAEQQRLIFELSVHPSADLQRLQHPLLQ
ncbi:winged helix-turn-helix domain-containing protein [Rheinheimera muenzenbergensis]|uniref:Winged helix-turn-helix domain-containing protein n=1 Tax=Rheinheimera muenzenbergensis TaxID=1193628 RepID=A0ABU8C629_9GAMM